MVVFDALGPVVDVVLDLFDPREALEDFFVVEEPLEFELPVDPGFAVEEPGLVDAWPGFFVVVVGSSSIWY